MSLAFIPACTAYRAFSRPSPTSPALFTGAAMSLAALTAAPPKDTVRPLFLYSCSSFPLQVLSLLSMSTFLPVMRASFPADGCRMSGCDGDAAFDASHGASYLHGFFGVIAVFFLFAPDGEA